MAEWENYPEIKAIRDRLAGGVPDDLVLLFVPSRTRDEKDISEGTQQTWADKALDLFGRLYEGGTGFGHLHGIYQPRGSPPQYDRPIMIQSLVKRADLESAAHLKELATFCRAMGEKLNQNSVGLVVNDVFINILIFHGRGKK